MAPNPHNLISSGVEPVDRLQGGLQKGSLNLVQGDASETSAFAIRFVIEGLKREETAALVMSYSPEDAIRRFAQMGYDCLEDIYSGRLAILEYTEETIQQIAALSEFGPVLRELEWLLGETKPLRITFDPVTTVLARKDINFAARAQQFAEWAARLGSTVVLSAPSDDTAVIEHLRPFVAEAFRFAPGAAGSTARTFSFEKSPFPLQQVEVDPSRGIFLSEPDRITTEAPPPAPAPEHSVDLPPTFELDAIEQGPLVDTGIAAAQRFSDEIIPAVDDFVTDSLFSQPPASSSFLCAPAASKLDLASGEAAEPIELEELNTSHPLDIDLSDQAPALPRPDSGAPVAPAKFTRAAYSRSADAKIGAASASRTVESLLSPPATASSLQDQQAGAESSKAAGAEQTPSSGFSVLVVLDDQESRAAISQALAGYATQFVQDGIAALSKLISFRPDLVLIDADLPIVDGFKVLEHIRASLNVPVIVLSGSRVRSSDRVLSSELGADYFLTKPFSARELAQKARLLIARHRGINSWILTGQSEQHSEATRQPQADAAEAAVEPIRFTRYDEFAAQVARRVEAAAAGGAPFSVVGCRLPGMTGSGGRVALQLFEIVRELARDTDPTTTNSRNDLLILLPDASAAGARAFAGRLRGRVVERINQEPTFWIRSFPESALGTRATGAVITGAELNQLRRATDDTTATEAGQSRQTHPGPSAMRAATSH